MNAGRPYVPGPASALLMLGCPLVAAGSLWITAAGGASTGRVLAFLALSFLASLLFAFSVARLCGLSLRRCAQLAAWGGAVSLASVVLIGLLAVILV